MAQQIKYVIYDESTFSTRLRATTRSQEGGTGSCSLSPRAKAKRMKMAHKMYGSSSCSSPTRYGICSQIFRSLSGLT